MSTLRITGFADGFDSKAIVESLVEIERGKQEKYHQLAYHEELKLAAWNEVETAMSGLRTLSTQLTSYSTWQQMSATTSNASVLAVGATSAAAEGTYSASVAQLAQAHRVGSDAQADITSALGLEGTFAIGGQEIAVTADQSLQAIRDAINLASLSMADDQAVKAAIVDTTLVLTRASTGATELSLADGEGDILEALGILDAGKGVKNELAAARDLEATVLGVSVTRATNTNITDVVAGVTLSFAGEGQSDFTIARDRETIKSLITDFVATYNSVMESTERRGTADVSSGEGAKAATLTGDSLLRSIQTRSRSLLTSSDDSGTLDGAIDSLRKIGIWTTGKENRLAVNGEALDEALTQNFQAVEDLFRSYDGGIMRKYDTYLRSLASTVDGSINRHQKGLQGKIDRYDAKIAQMERRLVNYEAQLWSRYTKVETIIAGLQSQGKYVNSLFESFSKKE